MHRLPILRVFALQLERRVHCLHPWDLTPSEAIALQKELAGRVRLQAIPEQFEVLGASDIGYVRSADQLVAVVLTFQWPQLELLETVHVVSPVGFPYVPGLLSFREVPPLLEAYFKLQRPPDVLLCDGQGIAHPRKLGLASHLGLCLEIPTVGCAKKRLCGDHAPFQWKRGRFAPLHYREEVVGHVFCSRDGIKPVFISPGHLADLTSSTKLIERCLGRYRIPEPLRLAHQNATRLRKELQEHHRGLPLPQAIQ